MKQTINKSQFIDAFQSSQYKGNFSYEGLCMLYEYLEDLADETGEEYELDIVALACEITESTYDEVISDYSIDMSDAINNQQHVLDYLEYNSIICDYNDDIVLYYQF
ncbi:MAG: hypothetical protein ABFD07_16785 [Methanobacterium sp.]